MIAALFETVKYKRFASKRISQISVSKVMRNYMTPNKVQTFDIRNLWHNKFTNHPPLSLSPSLWKMKQLMWIIGIASFVILDRVQVVVKSHTLITALNDV